MCLGCCADVRSRKGIRCICKCTKKSIEHASTIFCLPRPPHTCDPIPPHGDAIFRPTLERIIFLFYFSLASRSLNASHKFCNRPPHTPTHRSACCPSQCFQREKCRNAYFCRVSTALQFPARVDFNVLMSSRTIFTIECHATSRRSGNFLSAFHPPTSLNAPPSSSSSQTISKDFFIPFRSRFVQNQAFSRKWDFAFE